MSDHSAETTLTDEKLEEIRSRWGAATPGPWHVTWFDDDHAMNLIAVATVPDTEDSSEIVAATLVQAPRWASIADGRWEENAEAIAAAPVDTMRMLAEVDRLRAELAERESQHKGALDAMWETVLMADAETAGLRTRIDAVLKVIDLRDSGWVRLSERHPEHFQETTPEERARRDGWRQGVSMLTDRIRYALGVEDDDPSDPAPESPRPPAEAREEWAIRVVKNPGGTWWYHHDATGETAEDDRAQVLDVLAELGVEHGDVSIVKRTVWSTGWEIAPEMPAAPAQPSAERPSAPDGGTETGTPVSGPHDSAQESESHWLKFNSKREISGCSCGFQADLDSDCGWGDSVVAHLIEVGHAEQAEALKGAIRKDYDEARAAFRKHGFDKRVLLVGDDTHYPPEDDQPDLSLIPAELIVRDPNICSGRPTMRGTRILADTIARELAAGTTWKTLRECYPSMPVPSEEDTDER